MKIVPYGCQEINQADIDAVTAVLHSDYLTQGPAVPAFESAVSAYCGAQHAVAVNSATSALHIACIALGVGQGDIVRTSPITFVASANSALYFGATVDFVGIDPRTYNLSLERLAEKLASTHQTGRLPKLLIPVHLCGQACDMTNIPVYKQPNYESMGFKSGYCPAAESYYTETISLPIFPSLGTTDQDRVIATLTKVMA